MKWKFLLVFMLFIGAMNAQIVNIEGKRVDDKEGFFGNVDFSFSLTQNNSTIWQLANRIKAGYVNSRHMVLFINEINLVKADDKNFINSGFEHLRYNYSFKDSGMIKYEIFQQRQYNKIQKIQSRLIIGTGARFEFFRKFKKIDLNTGISFMWENEELTDDTGESNFRLSSYISVNWLISKLVKINTITYYQPKADYIADYRLSHMTDILFNINKFLALKLNYNLVHDSSPAGDVRKTNYTFRTGIQFRI